MATVGPLLAPHASSLAPMCYLELPTGVSLERLELSVAVERLERAAVVECWCAASLISVSKF
jgi:hypothetical protein